MLDGADETEEAVDAHIDAREAVENDPNEAEEDESGDMFDETKGQHDEFSDFSDSPSKKPRMG